MDYIKWATAMLPVAFEKFKATCMCFATCFFSLSQSLGKRSILAKS